MTSLEPGIWVADGGPRCWLTESQVWLAPGNSSRTLPDATNIRAA
jgi:hypothetical protein